MPSELGKLLFVPRVLPRFSANASGLIAGVIGGGALGTEMGLAAAAAAWGFNEPFGSFGSYLESGTTRLMIVPLFGAIGLLSGGLLGLAIARGDGLVARIVRVGLLAPIPLLIPTVLCATAAVIGAARQNVAVRVPEWTCAFPFQVAASPLPMFVWPVAWFWIWCWAVSKLEPLVLHECARCGYSRQGLDRTAVCPECGRAPVLRQ